MSKLRIGIAAAAIATLAATTGCGTSPSNSAANANDQEAAANIVATDDAQNVAELIVPKMSPAPRLSTIEGRTEAAIIDQLSCRKPVQAAKAINAMLRNGLLKETDDTGDGNFVYVPTKPLSVLGFPLVRVTGWQMMENSGDAMPPFGRGPGTPPDDHIKVTVQASSRQVRSAIKALGVREEGRRTDAAWFNGAVQFDRRRIPGVRI